MTNLDHENEKLSEVESAAVVKIDAVHDSF